MKICLVAIAVGCAKCPIVGVCPAKSVIGDWKDEKGDAPAKPPADGKSSQERRKS